MTNRDLFKMKYQKYGQFAIVHIEADYKEQFGVPAPFSVPPDDAIFSRTAEEITDIYLTALRTNKAYKISDSDLEFYPEIFTEP